MYLVADPLGEGYGAGGGGKPPAERRHRVHIVSKVLPGFTQRDTLRSY